jgi:hypothetical protein
MDATIDTVAASTASTDAALAEPTVPALAQLPEAAPKAAPVQVGTTVGDFLVFKGKVGFRLRLAATGKLVPERFENEADAVWYATRLTRLAGNTAQGKVFSPRVPPFVGPADRYAIVEQNGGWEVLRDGRKIGPTWTREKRAKYDAFRWAERCVRRGY